jgi:hypothetical protein
MKKSTPFRFNLSVKTDPSAVLGVNIPYDGGRRSWSSAKETPASAMNLAVWLIDKENMDQICTDGKEKRV